MDQHEMLDAGGKIDTCGITHPGKVREVNEDQFIVASLGKSLDLFAHFFHDSRTFMAQYVGFVHDMIANPPFLEVMEITAAESYSFDLYYHLVRTAFRLWDVIDIDGTWF